jgi:hypothetical protein
LSESFQFIANGILVESDAAEAAALFPAVREQLSVDGCALTFVLKNSGIKAADIPSLQLILSGESIPVKRSQFLLSGLLGNVNLEQQFVGCSKAGIRKNLSDLAKERRTDFESANLSIRSVEALDGLLLSESVSAGTEDALLRVILKTRSGLSGSASAHSTWISEREWLLHFGRRFRDST